ncbi:MAG: hypothetical protein ACR2PT_21465 [Endozoicomonas sp.]
MKIDPTTTSTNLDYGENPDHGSSEQREGSSRNRQEYQPIIPHDADDSSNSRQLKSRKASKKRKRLTPRKIAERRTRQQEQEQEQDEE